ncbi:MAG: hypothetical protein U0736_26295 [Gemmataceae bacterium]
MAEIGRRGGKAAHQRAANEGTATASAGQRADRAAQGRGGNGGSEWQGTAAVSRR